MAGHSDPGPAGVEPRADHGACRATNLDADFYFADPYASWQRGVNENTNGLIHQHLPKSRELATLIGPGLSKIENCLNHRPHKRLGCLRRPTRYSPTLGFHLPLRFTVKPK